MGDSCASASSLTNKASGAWRMWRWKQQACHSKEFDHGLFQQTNHWANQTLSFILTCTLTTHLLNAFDHAQSSLFSPSQKPATCLFTNLLLYHTTSSKLSMDAIKHRQFPTPLTSQLKLTNKPPQSKGIVAPCNSICIYWYAWMCEGDSDTNVMGAWMHGVLPKIAKSRLFAIRWNYIEGFPGWNLSCTISNLHILNLH